MNIAQLHKNAISAAKEIGGDNDAKQNMIVEILAAMRQEIDATLDADITLTRSYESDGFVGRHMDGLRGLVLGLIRSIQEMDQAIGHDRIHLAYDLFEGVRALAEDRFPPCEELIALLGIIGHDIGRYAEEKVFGKPMATQVHAWFSAHIMDSALKEAISLTTEEDKKIWKAIRNRVLGCIVAHFGANDVSDPLRHFVQSVDRLAGIFGIRDFARNLACDMHLRGARFWPNLRLDSAWGMSPFNNLPVEAFTAGETIQTSWTNVVHYVEAPMRTSYPLATERMRARADTMKIQAARLLMLLGGGIPRDPSAITLCPMELAMEIFAPELVAYVGIPVERFGAPPKTESLTRWDKWGKELPRAVWDEVWRTPDPDEQGNMKTMWPYIPRNIWPQMEANINLAWRCSFDESIFRPWVDLMPAYLAHHAYTLPASGQSALVRRILAETDADNIPALTSAFAFALAEARVRSREEQVELQHLQELGDAPLLSAVAKAIADERVFRLSEPDPA